MSDFRPNVEKIVVYSTQMPETSAGGSCTIIVYTASSRNFHTPCPWQRLLGAIIVPFSYFMCASSVLYTVGLYVTTSTCMAHDGQHHMMRPSLQSRFCQRNWISSPLDIRV